MKLLEDIPNELSEKSLENQKKFMDKFSENYWTIGILEQVSEGIN